MKKLPPEAGSTKNFIDCRGCTMPKPQPLHNRTLEEIRGEIVTP